VAADTAVEIEARTEAVTDALDFDEGVPAGSEERLLAVVRAVKLLPAPAGPPRTPGSRAEN